ncbi:MAG: Y-family DNA polymerase [Steroidobacteraceae bacterium]
MRAPKTLDLFAPERPAPRAVRPSVQPVQPHGASERATRPSQAPLWLAVHLPRMAPESDSVAPRALHSLAVRAQRFTPRISLAPPDALLLEVRSSLHLFGGLDGLRQAMAGECAALGQPAILAFAPSASAALAGTRADRAFTVLETGQLAGALAALPLSALRWPPQLIERLARIGVRTVGAALRLPRAGFAQRFGAAQLAALDQLTGRAADPRERFEAPLRFRRRRELPCESDSHALLAATLRALLEELSRFLAARQSGVLTLECRLWHRQAPPTECVLRLGAPLADAGRLAALLEERLRNLTLPEPVRACELRAGSPVPQPMHTGGLWPPGERGGLAAAPGVELIERLRARLGPEALETLSLVADRRPEAAWRAGPPAPVPDAGSQAMRCALPRPLWLLPAPRPLHQRRGLPRWRGALHLEGEPERIETGWWDGREVARDYYTARDGHGRRLWLFRERAPPHRWFLHGVYG